ncbi:HNH endonuclease signature motif containing protein [Microbispora hainanensis]|uniref:HNH endonuclease signature motif containing protein n=1 Tax=Microbispora hainanensis TaxID=568844 RepID=UPI0033E6EDDB
MPEIRVELTTLLGHDEHPAHLPGWGMVHAAQARRIVTGMLHGQWRYAICADDGHLLLTGITRRRPCPPAQRPPRDTRRGGIVELQITLTQLHRLAATPAATGAWAPLITDLARQARAQLDTTPQAGSPASAGSRHPGGACGPAVLSEQTDSADAAGVASTAGVASAAGVVNGADRRHADAALRRYVQIRGRVCSWPGCRMPATRTDQDHIQPWADNGTTTADNLHLACRHDHRAKHLGGWHVTTAGPHLIIWTSPLPKIIHPVPEPQPRTWPDAPPERLPGAPDTIMAPPCPPTTPPAETPAQAAGKHTTQTAGADSHGTKEHNDGTSQDESGATLIQRDLETPPF